MKRIVVLVLFIISTRFFYPQELIFAIGEWPPYTYASENGLATDIVTAACKSVGLNYRIIYVPWLRAESTVICGR